MLKTPYPPNQGLKHLQSDRGQESHQELKTPYPPNQGLKPVIWKRSAPKPSSLKPLIHQTKDWNYEAFFNSQGSKDLKTPYPPNQGLKRTAREKLFIHRDLKTPYPPNQGLKPNMESVRWQEPSLLKPLIHQTKDWNVMNITTRPLTSDDLKPLIHQTKDWNKEK